MIAGNGEPKMTQHALEKKLKQFQMSLQNPLLKWFYLHLPPRPITGKKMHRAYARVVSILMQERGLEGLHDTYRAAITQYLESVVPFLETYEKKTFPVKGATPEQVLAFLMEQNHLTQYDLAKDLGGQPVVSDVIHGRRQLTRQHIERLSKRFSVNPATFYPIS